MKALQKRYEENIRKGCRVMHSVTVLLSTYNGEKYIEEQIHSLMTQKNVKLSILARDDGSTDSTKKILAKYKDEGVLNWYTGRNLKPAYSFLDLINNAPESEYYAFCDQDDVWNDDKMKCAVEALESYGNTKIPRLYCANYQLVDAELKNLPDNGHASTTTFDAALVSSCCTGCTVVFNRELLNILRMGTPEVIVMHDDWVHKVCLAVGGTVYYDKAKVLKYRQHGNNADGGVHSVRDKIKGIASRIRNKDCIRSRQLKEINKIYSCIMTDDKRKKLELVADYKEDSVLQKIRLIFSKTICTPYERLNRGFRVAILFGYF